MSDRRKHPRGHYIDEIGVDGRPTRFCRRLIFEFFNTIGTFRICQPLQFMPGFRGMAAAKKIATALTQGLRALC